MTPLDLLMRMRKKRSASELTVFEKKSPGLRLSYILRQKRKYTIISAIEYEGRKCLLGMGLDLTDRKKSEEAIKKANERFERISSATNDAIFELF
jgi:PAS domain-containing protein